MATYRGKYPRRIQSVWSGALRDFNNPKAGRTFWCRSNDGALFCIDPVKANGILPKLGQDVDANPACVEQDKTT